MVHNPHVTVRTPAHPSYQLGDEARHVEVFSRYAWEKMPAELYPVTVPLASLLEEILTDPRWDMVALGMHIQIEALG